MKKTKKIYAHLVQRIDNFAIGFGLPANVLHGQLMKEVEAGTLSASDVPGKRTVNNRVRDVRAWMQPTDEDPLWNPAEFSEDSLTFLAAWSGYVSEHAIAPPNLTRQQALAVIRVLKIRPTLDNAIAFHIGLRLHYARKCGDPTSAILHFLGMMPWDKKKPENYALYNLACEQGKVDPLSPVDHSWWVEEQNPNLTSAQRKRLAEARRKFASLKDGLKFDYNQYVEDGRTKDGKPKKEAKIEKINLEDLIPE